MNAFTDVMGSDELAPDTMTKVTAGEHTVLLVRVGDAFYATQAHCPHLGGNLVEGKLDGVVLTCPLHHSQFNVTDGHVIRWTDWTGALDAISEAIRHPRPLRTYETRVEAGRVLIGPERVAATTSDSSQEHSS